ncbi:MAG: hypothetical protein AB8G96_08385 [Phycisphaerales bacterium]
MKKISLIGSAIGALALAGVASADIVEVDVSDMMSIAAFGDPGNMVIEVDLGALGYDTVTGVAWDTTLLTEGPSWASEAGFAFGDSQGEAGLFLRPGAGVNEPLTEATRFFSDINEDGEFNVADDILNLEGVGIPNLDISSGILRIELYESFNDPEVDVDANWLAGSTLYIEAIAIPAPGALALIGVAGLIGTRRRRG